MAVVRGLIGASVGGLLSAVPVIARAQTGTLTGRVIDSTSQAPITGVAVRIDGSPLGTLTRDDGTFTIAGVPTGARTLRISRIGFAAQTRPLTVAEGPNPALTIVMRQLVAQLSEVVAVGYGTQRREAVTGAVATVNTGEARVGVQPNVNQLIAGRAPGVQVTSNSGDPGSGAQIRVRGGTSISTSDEPLYVIDGVPILNSQAQNSGPGAGGDVNAANQSALPRSPLNTINPDDIADITILKDAASTAIYGSRAANGVVLITTKKGVAGSSTLDYDGQYGLATQARSYDLLSGNEYRSYVASQYTIYKADSAAGRSVLRGLPGSAVAALGAASTNWQDALARTANIQNQNVAFSGGSPSTQYRASVNYFDQPGVIRGNALNRVQGRLNGATRLLNDRLNVNLNLTASQNRDRYLFAENVGGFAGGVFTNAVTFNPTYPVQAPGTTTGGTATPFFEIGAGAQNTRNPVALVNQINDRGITNRVLGNLQSAYTLLPSLTASANVGVDRLTGERAYFLPLASPVGAQFGGLAGQSTRSTSTAYINTLLTYDRSFSTGFLGSQSLNVVGGYEYQRSKIPQFGATRQGFTTDINGFNNLSAGSTEFRPPYSNLAERVTVSYFTRVNYGLKDRYFVTGVLRRDGASVFGANNKYAVFPGASVAWRASQESFLRNLQQLSELKFRLSYGSQGNQAIEPYQSIPLLGADPGSRYQFGNTLVTGILPSQNANPNLRWQTTVQVDAGLDYGLFGNRITGTFDYYTKTTRDLLLAIPVPQPAVVSTQLQNIGRVRNAGIEGSIDGQIINQPGRTVTLGLVFSADRNRVVSLGPDVQRIFSGTLSGRGQSGGNSQIIRVGLPLGTFYGPVSAGKVDSIGNELFNNYDANGNVTGTVTAGQLTANANNYRVLGNANPRFTTGFRGTANIRRFDASFLVRAQTGFKILNATKLVYATKSQASQNQNFFRSALSDGIDITQSNLYSSRFVENGSFVRLQNVTLGYNVNLNTFVRRVSSARVYVSGDNLLLGTRYSGLDPEVFTDAGLAARGIDYLTYPRARVFTFGTRLGF